MNKRAFFTVFLMVFIDLLGFGIIIPILPFYAQAYGASAWELGLLMGTYSFFQFLFAPVWGRISDAYGRRPILLICILGSSAAYTLLGYAPSLVYLFLARSLAGIFGGNISTAYAYVTDTTDEKSRTKYMGLIGAALGLGFTFGPGLGAFLSQWGYSIPNYFAAGLAVLNFGLGVFWLKEPPGLKQRRLELRKEKRLRFETFLQIMNHRSSRVAIFVFFLFTLALTQMEVMFAIYMAALFGFNAQSTGYLMLGLGMLMVIMQGGFIGKLANRFGERTLILTALFLSGISLAAYASTVSLVLAITALAFLSIGRGILQPTLTTLASHKVTPTIRGVTMGFFQSGSSLARVIGPIIAGWTYQHYSPSTPFYLGAIFLAVAFCYFLISLRHLE